MCTFLLRSETEKIWSKIGCSKNFYAKRSEKKWFYFCLKAKQVSIKWNEKVMKRIKAKKSAILLHFCLMQKICEKSEKIEAYILTEQAKRMRNGSLFGLFRFEAPFSTIAVLLNPMSSNGVGVFWFMWRIFVCVMSSHFLLMETDNAFEPLWTVRVYVKWI